MGRAGMNHGDVLASLTTAPAARYGFAKSDGQVGAHYQADLVLLGSDPREDVTAFADVITTIRGGDVVFER